VKVMDLGVARLAEETLRLSQSGAFVGSVEYAAPEQFGAKEVGAAADLHALGLVLYELATAQHPYRADDFRGVMRKVLDERPRRPAEINPQLSPFFEELVLQLLEKDPAKRVASAAEVARILDDGEKSSWWRERARAIRTKTKRPLRRIRIPRETALYGRDAELARLRTLYDKAKSGEGQVLLVEGEAGIGKSRLLDEFVGLLQREGEDLNFLWGSYPPGGAATASGAFSTAYREHFGGEVLDDVLPAVLGDSRTLAPAFAALLRGEPSPEGAEPLRKDSLQTVFVHATRALARDRTTIVLIEDLHFAPDEGRALFASLALASPGHRVLLVGTTRPGLDERWLAEAQRQGAGRMALARLGAKDLVRLLADSLRSEHLAEELAGKIAAKSDGNPFFVFEILRGLREGQFLRRRDDGTWVTTRVIADIEVPSSVLDLVRARVADLAEEERDLLDVAACCGFEFDPLVVAAAAGVAMVPALKRLAQIERRHRLVRAAGDRYVFDHHQVQDALYGSLANPLRQAYHAAVADVLEARHSAAAADPRVLDGALCVDLAEHFLKGGQGARALRYLDPAMTHLERGYVNGEVIALAERALAAPGLVAGKERATLLMRKAERLDLLGRRDAARAAIDEALALVDADGDPVLRARVRSTLGAHLSRLARHEEAQAVLGEAIELARRAGDLRAEAGATGTLAGVSFRLSRYAEAEALMERQRVLARQAGDRQGETGAIANLGVVYDALGRYEDAQAQFERALVLATEAGDRRGQATCTGNLGNVFAARGRWDEAVVRYDRHLALARETGDRAAEALATSNLGQAFALLGRTAEAEERLERSLALAQEVGNRRGEAAVCGALSNLYGNVGRLADAETYGKRALALAAASGDRSGEANAAGYLGNVCASLGRWADAEGHFERWLALARETGFRQGEIRALINLGSVRLAFGDLPGARTHLDESLALCRTVGARDVESGARSRLARVADEEGDSAAAVRLAEEALGLRRALQQGWDVVESLLQVGDLRRRAGDTDGARAAIEEALPLATAQARAAAVARCLVHRAVLPGGDTAAAAAALTESAQRLEAPDALQARLLLWQATRDRAHLAEARRLLDFVVEHAPPACRESMLANVRLHREIAAACKEAGL
jgi:tetratricopeptide (TPR) repeat protein